MILVPRIAAEEAFNNFKPEFFEKLQRQILSECHKSSAKDFGNILPPWKTHYFTEFFEILLNQFSNKCAFCEVIVKPSKQEHNYEFLLYRNEQDYPWMKWQWPNWYLACFECYQIWSKKNKQRLLIDDEDQRVTECIFDVAILNDKENPLILDPCTENIFGLIKYIEVNNEHIEMTVDKKHPLSKQAETTLELLDLNRSSLQSNRYAEFLQFEKAWHLAVKDQSRTDVDMLLKYCLATRPFAGMKRYFLREWLNEYEHETRNNVWQNARDKIRQWQEETAVPPKPFPPPSDSQGTWPPPLPEFPLVRWKVTGTDESERKHYIRLLKALNPSFKELTVTREFGAGFSGAKVFLVTRKNMHDELLSPIVVKFDKLSSLQEEVNNYKAYINGRFTKCVSLENDIIELPNVPYSCIAYQLAGGGKFDVESIKSYWQECSTIQEACNPLKTIVADWKDVWIEGETKREYSLLTYDWLFPPNFVVEVESASDSTDIKPISPDNIFELLNSSAYLEASVCIQPTPTGSQSFIITEVNENKGEVTLDLPENQTDRFRICLSNMENIRQFKTGEAIRTPIYGRIKNDRITFLKKIVANAFDHTSLSLNKNQVVFPGLENFPLENPLHQLPDILNIDLPSAKVSIVHGDMNLENILIRTDSQGHDISVIDFGKTRKAHNIHDLLRLETSVWLYLITWRLPNLTPGDGPALTWQIRKIYSLFKSVHEFVVEDNFDNSEIDLSIPYAILRQIRQYAFDRLEGAPEQNYKSYYLGLCLYMLGALKFKNLDSPENKAPIPRQVAFQVACLAYHTAENGELDKEPVTALPPEGEPSGKFLHNELADAFNKDELVELCYEIGIDYEQLSGENVKRKAVELVQYCKRHKKINTLIEHCERKRPSRDWNSLQI